MQETQRNQRFHKICIRVVAFAFVGILGVFTAFNFPGIIKSFQTAWSDEELPEIKQKLGRVETEVNDNFFIKYPMINLNGGVHVALGQRFMNDVWKMNDDMLITQLEYDLVPQFAQSVTELSEYVESLGKKFLYVSIPYKTDRENSALPEGLMDGPLQAEQDMLSSLQANGVWTLSLRERAEEQGMGAQDLFLRTDTHWKPEMGLWSSTEIVREIQRKTGIKPDEAVLDPQNYNNIHFKNWMLGSLGKRTGMWFDGTDDITLVYPKFDTQLEASYSVKGEEPTLRSGNFQQTAFFYNRLFATNFKKGPEVEAMMNPIIEGMKNNTIPDGTTVLDGKDYFAPDEYFIAGPYTTYEGDLRAMVQYQNPNAAVDQKMLILRDSYGIAISPFLALSFSEVHGRDLRKYWKDSVFEYIEKEQPDVVVMMVATHALREENPAFFNFGEWGAYEERDDSIG